MNEDAHRRLEDYRYTNEQILLHQRWIVEVFIFSVVVTVALLGYGLVVFFGANGGRTGLAALVFLVPTAIILPSAYMMYLFRSAIFNLIGYAMEIHQVDVHGYDWKSYDEEYDEIMRRYRRGVLKQSLVYPFVTYWILFAILSLLYSLGIGGFLPNAEKVCCAWTFLILLPFVLLFAITWYYCQLPERLRDFRHKWKEIRTKKEANREKNG